MFGIIMKKKKHCPQSILCFIAEVPNVYKDSPSFNGLQVKTFYTIFLETQQQIIRMGVVST